MTFETSQTTEKLDAALAKVQGDIQPAIKDKTNPAFKSKYADIAAVWDAAREALAKHGVSVTQWPMKTDDARLEILTRVAHQGEWMRAVFSIPIGKQDAHGYGSATTYARRFTLMAALGIAPDDDDDGNAASGKGLGQAGATPPVTPNTGKKEAGQPKADPAVGTKERDHVGQLCVDHEWAVSDAVALMQKKWGKQRVMELTYPQYQELCATIAAEKPGTNDADLPGWDSGSSVGGAQ